jgi:hypothetical protein
MSTFRITDSDDGMTGLETYSFYQSGGQVYIHDYTNLYTSATDVMITQLTRLNMNTGIEPNHGENGEVPEPATMILFGTGLLGLALTGRRLRRS